MADPHDASSRSTTAGARPEREEDGWKEASWAAARAARRFLVSARGFRASITSIEPRGETYRRGLFVIERRAVELRTAPADPSQSKRRTSPLPEPASVDPWTTSTDDIQRSSRVLAECATCEGKGGTPCAVCEGRGALACPRCQGLGRVREGSAVRACPECDGQGRIACESCDGGLVTCTACEGAGRLVAWLLVDKRVYRTVTVVAHGSAADAHGALREPADFDAGATSWPNPLARDTGVLPPDAPLPKDLLPTLDRRWERIRSARMQVFGAVVHRMTYATPLGVGMVEVTGKPPALCDTTEWRPLEIRRVLLLATFGVGVFLALMIRRGYEARGAWFAAHGHGWGVAGAVTLASLLVTIALGGALLAPKGRTFVRLWLPLALSIGAITLATSAYKADPPTAAHAKVALTAGDFEGARSEAEAMLAIGSDEAAARWILDAAHVHDVVTARDLASAVAEYQRGFRDDGQRNDALASIRARAAKELQTLSDDRNTLALFAAADSLAPLDPVAAARARATAARFRVDDCVQHKETACSFHGELLDESTRRFLEFRLAAARFERAIEDGDFDAAWTARDDAKSDGAPQAEIDRLDAIALPALEARAAEVRRAVTNATSLASRRAALVDAVRIARATTRFVGHEPSPPTSFYEAQLAALDRSIAGDTNKR